MAQKELTPLILTGRHWSLINNIREKFEKNRFGSYNIRNM